MDHRALTTGDSGVIGTATLRALAGDHAVIHPDLPRVHYNGYLINDALLHPGDAFVMPSQPVRVLLLPAGVPG